MVQLSRRILHFHRQSLAVATAFLKRGSLVRVQPGILLSPSIQVVDGCASSATPPRRKGVIRTGPVQGPHPYGRLSREWREDVPRVTGVPEAEPSDGDVLAPLRKVTSGGGS